MSTSSKIRGWNVRAKAVDPSVALAVAQQNLMLGMVLGGEGVFNKQQMRPIFPALGAFLLAFVLINSDNDVATPIGLFVGMGACAYTMKIEAERFGNTPSDETDWPGPKVFPSLLAVLATVQLITNFQGFGK